jgi:hypothetical protein
MFTRMPLTRPHPPEWVDRGNFQKYVVGYTGDTATIEYLPDIKEIAVCGSMALAADEAIDAYDRGVVDLSPGYAATFVWKKGKTDDGRAYDAVMVSIEDTNHLALVNKGRGGATAAILDAMGVMKAKQIGSRIWYRAKRAAMVMDEMASHPASEATGFRSGLDHLIGGRAALKDEELAGKVDELKSLLSDLPDGNEKGLLLRYMSDMKLMKEQKDGVVREAADLACALFDKLDKHALSESGLGGMMRDCADCHGTGKIGDMPCANCKDGKLEDDVITGEAEKAMYSKSPMGKEGGKAGPLDAPGARSDYHETASGVEVKPDDPAKEHEREGDPVKENLNTDPLKQPVPEINPDPDGHDRKGDEGKQAKGETSVTKDEPDPAVPAAVPPAAPKPQAPSPSPGGVPSAAPAGPQAAPGAPPGAAAPAAQGGPQFWMTKLAELLKGMMSDPQIQQMMGGGGAPGAAPAPGAPAAPAAPAVPGAVPGAAAPAAAPAPVHAAPPAAAPPAAPAAEKKDGPPAPGAAKDSAPSLDDLVANIRAPVKRPSVAKQILASPEGHLPWESVKVHDAAPSLTALLASSEPVSSGATLDGIVNSIKGRKG